MSSSSEETPQTFLECLERDYPIHLAYSIAERDVQAPLVSVSGCRCAARNVAWSNTALGPMLGR